MLTRSAMDNFIFKVPKLPEDAALHRRKANNFIVSKSDSINSNYHGECQKSQSSLFDQCNRMGNNCGLQTIREGILEDAAQPSTSRCRNVLQTSSNNIGVFCNSFDRFGRDGFQDNAFKERHNYFVNSTTANNRCHSVFNPVNLPRMSHSEEGNRFYENSLNFSSLRNSRQSSINNSHSRNTFLEKADGYRGMNSSNRFPKNWYSSGINMMESNHSSLGLKKSVFSSSAFPQDCEAQKFVNVTDNRNHFTCELKGFDCTTNTSAIQKDPRFWLNASQNAADKQSFMMSVWQMSVVSGKEEIMNKIENLGQSLLRSAPELGTLFAQTAKDIKNILDKRICLNPVLSANGFSSLSCTSGMIGCVQQSIWQDGTTRQQCESIKKPSSVLENLTLKENENPKCELIKSFTVKRKKKKTLNNEDGSFQTDVITENFSIAPRKFNDKAELNLKEWYPVIQKNGLAFIGLNDENVEVETDVMKERINNRRIKLENGAFCNLLGNPSRDKSFPKIILTKIKNGLQQNWRKLIEIIATLEKTEQKEKMKLMEEYVSTTAEFETSLNSTVLTRSRAKLLKISNLDKQKAQEKISLTCAKMEKVNVQLADSLDKDRNSKSPKDKDSNSKSSKDKDRNSKSPKDKDRNSKAPKNNAENVGKKRSHSPVEKLPTKIQKTNAAKRTTDRGSEDKGEDSTRILSITRSGRVVKRPKDILAGASLTETDTCEKSRMSSELGKEMAENLKKKKSKNLEEKGKKQAKGHQLPENKKEEKSGLTVNSKPTKRIVSPISTKRKGKIVKKVTSKSVLNGKSLTSANDNPWGNEIDGLEDIYLPDISIHQEEIISDRKKLKLLTTETPPLKNIRNNLTFLENYTPIHTPDWQVSRHTRSAVKKFEKLRAQAFKTKIPRENSTKKEKKLKNSVRSNKEIDTVINWISEREVRSPKKSSNLINYLLPKRNELEDENEDSEDGMKDEEEILTHKLGKGVDSSYAQLYVAPLSGGNTVMFLAWKKHHDMGYIWVIFN